MQAWPLSSNELHEPYDSSIAHLQDELLRLDVLVREQVERARCAAENDRYRGLAITESEVDALLARANGRPPWDAASLGPSLDQAQALDAAMADRIAERVAASRVPLRLALLSERFKLTRFELDVVLLALAPEIDLRYERLYAYLHDDLTRKRPSVDLALHLFCRSFEERVAARARFASTMPLGRQGLVRLDSDADLPLLARSLRVAPRVVDWLHGSDESNPELAAWTHRITGAPRPDTLLLADKVGAQVRALEGLPALPRIYLRGPDGVGKRTLAAAVARSRGYDSIAVDATRLEGLADAEVKQLLFAALLEARLTHAALIVERADLLLAREHRGVRDALFELLVESPTPLFLTGEKSFDSKGAPRKLPLVHVELAPPDSSTRLRLWNRALTGTALAKDVDVERLAARLRLTSGQIYDAATTAKGLSLARCGLSAPVAMSDLDDACRRQLSLHLEPLARRVPTTLTWEDLVLPEERLVRLRELCEHARRRAFVFEHWGFERRLPTGKGLGVLFAGAPGTGKTLAASIVAAELGLDLYQVDLASIVSKWIGETEKQLARVFDEAERGHGILFFDEADVLFGKRTELRDAHDRFANLESSYLLQRIERYEGIVILATNFRRNLDEAFVRRLRFIVEFPLPDERERLEIWRRIWPPELPLADDLDLPSVARRFELSGAHIRNIALGAAFLAAADGQAVAQRHLSFAARREYQNIGKILDEGLFTTPPSGVAIP